MVAIRKTISKLTPGWLRDPGSLRDRGSLGDRDGRLLHGLRFNGSTKRLRFRGSLVGGSRPRASGRTGLPGFLTAGFTLVELMVVMLIISILLAVAVPSFISAIRTAREAALRQDLHTMRDAIEQYTEDKQAAPQSLDDLVQAGYLRKMPVDPMTHSSDTWVPDQSDTYSDINQSEPGIDNVHSGSNRVGSDGVPYSQW